MMGKGVSGKKETASASKLQSNKSKSLAAGVQTVPRSASEKQSRSTPHNCEKPTPAAHSNNKVDYKDYTWSSYIIFILFL